MKRVGLVGWRGMVGSVLMQRMREENDFALIEPVFFTTSNTGGKAPNFGKEAPALKDAKSIDELLELYAQGKVKPHVSERFPLERGADAIAHLGSRQAMGKVVVTID